MTGVRAIADGTRAGRAAESRPFETPLLLAGARCTLRYLVLPFMLPLLGVATGPTAGIVTGASFALLLTLDVIAVVAVVATLRGLWRLQHPAAGATCPLRWRSRCWSASSS